MKNIFRTTILIDGEYLGAELVEFSDKGMLLRLESKELVIMDTHTFEMWCKHPELNLLYSKRNFGFRYLC